MANVFKNKNKTIFNFKPHNINQFNLLDKIENRNNIFLAKSKIEEFNINFINGLNLIMEKYPNNDINFDEYLTMIVDFSDNVDNNLVIKSQKDLDKLIATVEMSDILLKQGIRNNDIETMEVSFSNLESGLKVINVLK